MYWLPPAIGPPRPSLKGSRSCFSRPCSGSRTSPVRVTATRTPTSSASRAAASQATQTWASKVDPGRRGLVDERLAAVAVVADRRLADQRPRARVGGADRVDQVLGRPLAALADALLGGLGPALVDRLADQVDDAVDALEGGRGRALGGGPPGVPGDGWIPLPRALGVAGQADDLVAAGQQRVADARAEKAAGTGDQYAHGCLPAVGASFERREGAGLLGDRAIPRDAPPRPPPRPPRARRRGRRRSG